MNLKRYLSIYLALLRNSLTREMMFKANFLLWIVVELLWFALQLAFIGVVYMHTEKIGTWTKWEVVLLFGVSFFIQQLFHAFFLINCTNMSELVRSGKLDFLMLQPVNTRFMLSLRQVDFGAMVNAATAVAVMVYAAHQLHLVLSFTLVAGFLALCVIGTIIHYSLMFALSSISFWTVRAQGVVWSYYNLFQIARMPDEAFKGVFRAAFTFVVPMLLVANVPARVLADKVTDWKPLAYMLGMSVFCWMLSRYVWRKSVGRYTSASS